eukprot:tig00001371_g8437.t1
MEAFSVAVPLAAPTAVSAITGRSAVSRLEHRSRTGLHRSFFGSKLSTQPSASVRNFATASTSVRCSSQNEETGVARAAADIRQFVEAGWARHRESASLKTAMAAIASLMIAGAGVSQPSYALPSSNPVKGAYSLLRLSLPVDNKPIRECQLALENMTNAFRIPMNAKWTQIRAEWNKAQSAATKQEAQILAAVPSARQEEAKKLLEEVQGYLNQMRESIEEKNGDVVALLQQQSLDKVGKLEELMISEFPYSIPEEYKGLPRLLGRATVEFDVEATKAEGGVERKARERIVAVVDGYSAPITAGNFVDLVQRGFYDGLDITRSDGFVIQSGDPAGPAEGFVDPKTGEERKIPLEILVKGDKSPTYGVTLEDAGRPKAEPVLPFSAYGTMAMARPEFEFDGASSQFFWVLFEAELTPAGANLLDGRYSVFGYVTTGADVLKDLKVGDRIVSAKVKSGIENLVSP